MAESIEEISYDYEEEGRQVRRELERAVLSKGSWVTMMFLYQELDRKSDEWRPPKIAIVRYKKWNGTYRKQSGFNISSEKQARQIVDAIEGWFGNLSSGDGDGDADSGEADAGKAKAKARPKAKAKAKAKPKTSE